MAERCPICRKLLRLDAGGRFPTHDERRSRSVPWVNRCIGSGLAAPSPREDGT
jgi:hypothetical protein